MRRCLPILAALLLTSVGAASAATPVQSRAVYTGRSAQGIPVRLAAEVDGARWFRYRARMTCNDGSTFLDDYFSDDVTISHDRFDVAYRSDGGAVSTRVTGTLTARRASGTIRIVERYSELAVDGVTPLSASGAIVCDSKTVRWSAHA